MSNFHYFVPYLINLHYCVFCNSFPSNFHHRASNFFWGFAFHLILLFPSSFLPWPSLFYGECPWHWFHYITLYPPTPHPISSSYYFVLLLVLHFFVQFFSIFCEFVGYFVHHPNHITKVTHLNCTTNVSHHPSQMTYVFLF